METQREVVGGVADEEWCLRVYLYRYICLARVVGICPACGAEKVSGELPLAVFELCACLYTTLEIRDRKG